MGKTVLIHAFEEQMFGVFVVLYEMLFIGHDEVVYVLCDRMILVQHLYLKRTERWMLFRDRSEHIPKIVVVRTYIRHIVVKERTPAVVHEFPDGSALFRGDPIQGLRVWFGNRWLADDLRPPRPRLRVSVGPKHTIAQDDQKPVTLQFASIQQAHIVPEIDLKPKPFGKRFA